MACKSRPHEKREIGPDLWAEAPPQRPQPTCSKAKARVAPPRLSPQLPLHPNQRVKIQSSPALYSTGWGAPTVTSAGHSALATGSDGFKVPLQHTGLLYMYLCAHACVCIRVCVNVCVCVYTYTRIFSPDPHGFWIFPSAS